MLLLGPALRPDDPAFYGFPHDEEILLNRSERNLKSRCPPSDGLTWDMSLNHCRSVNRSPQSAGASEMPQMFRGLSSAMPNSKGRSRLANTTRPSADLVVKCTCIVMLA